jgi:hypothetical protein
MNGFNSMGGNRMSNPNGRGRGRGAGDREEAPDEVAGFDTRVPQQMQKGQAVATGFAPPREVTPGQSLAEIQAEIQKSEGSDMAEAMSNQRVPGSVKKHVLGYFDQIRKGQ